MVYFSNTPCIFCAFNHCVEYYLWFCNHPSCACVCVSWNLSFLSAFGQSMCMVLYCVLCVWWSSIHLYLIWSGTIGGTMCEREALSIRMGGGQHSAGGQYSGGGQHIRLDTREQRGKRKPLRRHRSSSPQREPPLLYITLRYN